MYKNNCGQLCTNLADCNYNKYRYNFFNGQFGSNYPSQDNMPTIPKGDGQNVKCYDTPIYYTGPGTSRVNPSNNSAAFNLQPNPGMQQMYEELFNPVTISMISNKITELLQGVDEGGKDIIVSPENICGILSSVLNNYNAIDDHAGLNTMFQMTTTNGNLTLKEKCIIGTINIIVSHVRTETERIKCNKSLTIWDTVYGDFNDKGLRAHPPLKIQNNNVNKPEFHMRY